MAGRASLITNNPFFSTSRPACADVLLVRDDARAVLICARDLVHKGWRLANHPLYGNFRPHQQPYRSLVLFPPAGGSGAVVMEQAAARRCCPGARKDKRRQRPPVEAAAANAHELGGSRIGAQAASEDAVAALAPGGPPGRSPAVHDAVLRTGAREPFRRAQSPPGGVAPVDPESLHFLEEALLIYQTPASNIRQSRPEDLPEIMRRDCALLDCELLKATLESLL